MKKITLALVAFMLVLGMTQCKKEQQNNIIPDEGETVYITMKVADDGGKHTVYPGTGAVVYGDGDVIYVGNNGHYVGTLTYANGAFSGTITSPSTSDYLHFYFTGGKTPANNPTTNTTSFTVNISDQSTNLPVLSYGHSKTKYVDGTTAYTCMLENKCGLVKFVPSEATSNPITVSGMKTTATINFATPGITPTDATGAVTLYSVSGSEKWAILLPQDEVVSPIVNNNDFSYPSIESVPAITINMYYNSGVNVNMRTTPLGAISGLFTINANGDKVFFSQGNLQYQASTNTWRFAENQWDYIGYGNDNISSSNSGWIDLFGWGTSGYHDVNDEYNVNYQPWSTSDATVNTTYNYYGYGPSNNMFLENQTPSLTGDIGANYDWGVYNPISNGGNSAGQWRNLTYYEWNYLLKTRTTSSGMRYVKAIVNGVNGLILIPDNATNLGSYIAYQTSNNASSNYSSNTINSTVWANFEAVGAVFLPAAGSRMKTTTNTNTTGQNGNYWTSSGYPASINETTNKKSAYIKKFTNTTFGDYDSQYRYLGLSVRLVRDSQ